MYFKFFFFRFLFISQLNGSTHSFFLLFLFLQTQNTVYEIVSDMSSRQDAVEERLTNLEDKIQTLQV